MARRADRFDLEGYLSGLSPAKRKISRLIQRLAESYGIDVRIALAVALAKSNLNSQAVSPMSARGVMQLIPATQERFGVKDPFDAEANIKGGLAYLVPDRKPPFFDERGRVNFSKATVYSTLGMRLLKSR